jgi:hypothetical protein
MENRLIVIDTETADLTGSVYDVGYCIANVKGEILIERNWLVEEVFTDAKKMMGAYFAKKMFTHYARMLQDGEIKMVKWQVIVDHMRWDFRDYKVNIIAAYNLSFDRRVLANTHRMLGNNRPILPPVKQLDLWRFACESKLNTKLYKRLCEQLGWKSDANNYKTTAEHAYRYISSQWYFEEDHTALSDARIETQIMASCYAAHKKVPYNIVDSMPWKIVNAKGKNPHVI